ncbi:hypothetical protein K435DRAFT_825185 [Dendrothele bispora CBS 962.96]|uniref:Calcineurin-like phosphoesterase domain-containing protein n=1 Tax=Dendrothele bispora (strain CBS 962.96) TaxID=1314807 RepID=A0A4S8MXJ6_DENBC|nr:hypothetical protein K435DRAFT_825185 [Dendrothele bispora CBS 962.96]
MDLSFDHVYTAYRTIVSPNEGVLPPHPGPSWTRFVCISDTHSHTEDAFKDQIPSGDFLLHSGDLSSWGKLSQLRKTVDWIGGLEGFEYKVLIAGNHDFCLDAQSSMYDGQLPETVKKCLEEAQELMRGEEARAKGIIYLEYEQIALKTKVGREWILYGSPAAPRYADGAFQYTNRVEAKAISSLIPSDVEILLTHTPAHGILDWARRGRHAGCESLLERLGKLSKLHLHVFGHIHESKGAQIVPLRPGAGIYAIPEVERPKRLEWVAVNAAMLAVQGPAIVVDLMN